MPRSEGVSEDGASRTPSEAPADRRFPWREAFLLAWIAWFGGLYTAMVLERKVPGLAAAIRSLADRLH